MQPHVFRYIASELHLYRARKAQIAAIKDQIAQASKIEDNPGGTRPVGKTSDPTLASVLAMERDKDLHQLEMHVHAIERGLALLNPTELRIVTMMYLERRYTTTGVAVALGLSLRHVRRTRTMAFEQIARGMGIPL